MYEEILTELLPFFAGGSIQEEQEVNLDGDILKVSINKGENENKITLTVEYIEDEFRKYIDSLDEDIFIEACEKFEDLTGQHLSDDVDTDLFKEVVRNVIAQRIDNLKKFL
jgi:hypothetical protein